MFKLRNPFVYVGKKPKLTQVRCFSCGVALWLSKNNLRVINYCTSCR